MYFMHSLASFQVRTVQFQERQRSISVTVMTKDNTAKLQPKPEAEQTAMYSNVAMRNKTTKRMTGDTGISKHNYSCEDKRWYGHLGGKRKRTLRWKEHP